MMFDDYYDDSMRLDEMMTADDYNRFEERELARDRSAEMAAADDSWERYGTEALCGWCEGKGYESVGEQVATSIAGDHLVCPTCNHEWLALPKDEL